MESCIRAHNHTLAEATWATMARLAKLLLVLCFVAVAVTIVLPLEVQAKKGHQAKKKGHQAASGAVGWIPLPPLPCWSWSWWCTPAATMLAVNKLPTVGIPASAPVSAAPTPANDNQQQG